MSVWINIKKELNFAVNLWISGLSMSIRIYPVVLLLVWTRVQWVSTTRSRIRRGKQVLQETRYTTSTVGVVLHKVFWHPPIPNFVHVFNMLLSVFRKLIFFLFYINTCWWQYTIIINLRSSTWPLVYNKRGVGPDRLLSLSNSKYRLM